MTDEVNCIEFELEGDEFVYSATFIVPISLLIRMNDKEILEFGLFMAKQSDEITPFENVIIRAGEREHELSFDDFFGMCVDGTLIDHIKKIMSNTVPALEPETKYTYASFVYTVKEVVAKYEGDWEGYKGTVENGEEFCASNERTLHHGIRSYIDRRLR